MNSTRRKLLGLSTLIVAGLSMLYLFHVRIESWLWHVRHGTSISIADYIVPVPSNWYVQDIGDGDQLLVRLDTDDRSARKRLKAHSGVTLHIAQMKPHDQNVATSLDMAFLKKERVDPILQQAFSLSGDTISCVGGEIMGSRGVYDVEPVSWLCRSQHGLEIMIISTERDVQQVWEIISGIRRKP